MSTLEESLKKLKRFSKAMSDSSSAGTLESQRLALRELAKANLYFLCKGVLKFSKPFYSEGLSPLFHGPLCAELDEVQLPYGRSLDLWPRGHIKTHVITVAKNIQHYLRNNDSRILLVGSNEDNSKKNLHLIKEIFGRNTLLHWLFPECIPNHKSDTWSETAITLPRPHNRAETTFKAIGWGGRITGWHFDVTNKDDLIDEKTEKSPEVMEKITSWHLLSKNLLESPTTGVDQVVGTRWLTGDVYGYIIKHEPEYDVRHVAAMYRDERTNEWVASWPDRFTVEALFTMREKDPYMFACQQMNNPKDEAIVAFNAKWIRYFSFSDDAMNILVEA